MKNCRLLVGLDYHHLAVQMGGMGRDGQVLEERRLPDYSRRIADYVARVGESV